MLGQDGQRWACMSGGRWAGAGLPARCSASSLPNNCAQHGVQRGTARDTVRYCVAQRRGARLRLRVLQVRGEVVADVAEHGGRQRLEVAADRHAQAPRRQREHRADGAAADCERHRGGGGRAGARRMRAPAAAWPRPTRPSSPRRAGAYWDRAGVYGRAWPAACAWAPACIHAGCTARTQAGTPRGPLCVECPVQRTRPPCPI
eukprot:365853-Chlamydomonas_euryale.AAC.5